MYRFFTFLLASFLFSYQALASGFDTLKVDSVYGFQFQNSPEKNMPKSFQRARISVNPDSLIARMAKYHEVEFAKTTMKDGSIQFVSTGTNTPTLLYAEYYLNITFTKSGDYTDYECFYTGYFKFPRRVNRLTNPAKYNKAVQKAIQNPENAMYYCVNDFKYAYQQMIAEIKAGE